MSGSPQLLIVGLNYWPEPSGNAPYTSYLARALSEKHNLKVITAYPHYPWWRIPDGWAEWPPVPEGQKIDLLRVSPWLPRRQSNLQRARLEIWFGLRAVFSRWGKRDVVLLVSPAMFSSAISLIRIKLFHRKTKVILWVQDLYSLGLKETQKASGFGFRLVSKVERWLLSSVDRVVVIHDRFQEALARDFKIDADRVDVIRNWSQLDFHPTESAEATRMRYNWLREQTIVLHTGNIGVKQGLSGLVEMAGKIYATLPDLKFVLLGDGNQRARLEIAAAGFSNVEFIDPVSESELCNLLQAADIALVHEQPGVAEMAVPSKLTSYFIAGKPVIGVTDPGSITAQEIHQSFAGVAVKPGDPQSFTRALSLVFKNRESYASEAKSFASSKLNGKTALIAFEAIIHELASCRGNTK